MNYICFVTSMALRSGRQRSSAAPIIAKGLVYPLQNQRASKSVLTDGINPTNVG